MIVLIILCTWLDAKDSSSDLQVKQGELHFMLVLRWLSFSSATSIQASILHKGGVLEQARFTRNASLVASGVARNIPKVGNYIKDNLDGIFYQRRAKIADFGN